MRLGYVADTSNTRVSRALRLFKAGGERRTAVVADMKRTSPTSPTLGRNVGFFHDAGRRATELFDMGVNIILANVDGPGWGGDLADLDAIVAAQKRRDADGVRVGGEGVAETAADRGARTAVVCKDLFIHPLQVARAVERGADGVLLMAPVLGPVLADLLDTCTVMGTEALVEVHTPEECRHALEVGATALLLNCWDRSDGSWHPGQAEAVRRLVPDHVLTVATGGIGSSEQAARHGDAGFDAVCLGRALALHPEPAALVRNIRGHVSAPLLPGTNGF